MIFIAPDKFKTSLPTHIQLENCSIIPLNSVRNLGFSLDSILSFENHISSLCRICYLELRRISAIRHLLTQDATKTLVCAFILSRLDYCNSLLAGCPRYLIQKLQKIQNNAARLVVKRSRTCHVSPLLLDLHWLTVERRIHYKLPFVL